MGCGTDPEGDCPRPVGLPLEHSPDPKSCLATLDFTGRMPCAPTLHQTHFPKQKRTCLPLPRLPNVPAIDRKTNSEET